MFYLLIIFYLYNIFECLFFINDEFSMIFFIWENRNYSGCSKKQHRMETIKQPLWDVNRDHNRIIVGIGEQPIGRSEIII